MIEYKKNVLENKKSAIKLTIKEPRLNKIEIENSLKIHPEFKK